MHEAFAKVAKGVAASPNMITQKRAIFAVEVCQEVGADDPDGQKQFLFVLLASVCLQGARKETAAPHPDHQPPTSWHTSTTKIARFCVIRLGVSDMPLATLSENFVHAAAKLLLTCRRGSSAQRAALGVVIDLGGELRLWAPRPTQHAPPVLHSLQRPSKSASFATVACREPLIELPELRSRQGGGLND